MLSILFDNAYSLLDVESTVRLNS